LLNFNRASRLRNVELIDVRFDMRSIFGGTRVLLVPSVCNVTWGRIASKAQFSSVPVPEAIGPVEPLSREMRLQKCWPTSNGDYATINSIT
jgi:hypothetical protein